MRKCSTPLPGTGETPSEQRGQNTRNTAEQMEQTYRVAIQGSPAHHHRLANMKSNIVASRHSYGRRWLDVEVDSHVHRDVVSRSRGERGLRTGARGRGG